MTEKNLVPLHVEVKFGAGVPYEAQCQALLSFEKTLCSLTGLPVEVFKESRGDDSKLRAAMTPEQRNRL